MKATATHYTVLGLLAARDWSTYDLIQYMQSSYLQSFWSKTESRLYQTPKELVAPGYASSRKERISDRAGSKGRERTVYGITDAGREALAGWLAEPPQAPTFEVEALIKLALADAGTLEGLLLHIESLRTELASGGRIDTVSNAAENPLLPSRVHLASHMADLLDRVVHTVLEWADDFHADVLTWDTVQSTPEHVEQGKARYRALAQRIAADNLR